MELFFNKHTDGSKSVTYTEPQNNISYYTLKEVSNEVYEIIKNGTLEEVNKIIDKYI